MRLVECLCVGDESGGMNGYVNAPKTRLEKWTEKCEWHPHPKGGPPPYFWLMVYNILIYSNTFTFYKSEPYTLLLMCCKFGEVMECCLTWIKTTFELWVFIYIKNPFFCCLVMGIAILWFIIWFERCINGVKLKHW